MADFKSYSWFGGMTLSDWNYYFLGWTAWTIDAIDFFCVSAAAPKILATLGVDILYILDIVDIIGG